MKKWLYLTILALALLTLAAAGWTMRGLGVGAKGERPPGA